MASLSYGGRKDEKLWDVSSPGHPVPGELMPDSSSAGTGMSGAAQQRGFLLTVCTRRLTS